MPLHGFTYPLTDLYVTSNHNTGMLQRSYRSIYVLDRGSCFNRGPDLDMKGRSAVSTPQNDKSEMDIP